jgi:hypothetical protein
VDNRPHLAHSPRLISMARPSRNGRVEHQQDRDAHRAAYEGADLPLAQFDRDTAESLPTTFAVKAHSFSGSGDVR